MITECGKDQVRQTKWEDHPGDGIHPVKPIHEPEINLQIRKKKPEVFENRQYQDVEDDQNSQGLFPVAPFPHRIQPPAPEIVPGNYQRYQSEEDRDERKVIHDARHQQPDPAVFTRKKVVDNRDRRQKKKICEGIKDQLSVKC